MKFFSRIFLPKDIELQSKGLPTRIEINPDRCLDGRYAEKHFTGKTIEEAEALLSDGSSYYYEDLMWMGKKAFSFYVPAALTYLKNEDSKDDADVVNQLYGIISLRLESNDLELDSCRSVLIDICEHVLDHYEKFDICEIYDRYDASEERKLNLKECYTKLKRQLVASR